MYAGPYRIRIIFEINYLKRLFEHLGKIYILKEIKEQLYTEKTEQNILAKWFIIFCKIILSKVIMQFLFYRLKTNEPIVAQVD